MTSACIFFTSTTFIVSSSIIRPMNTIYTTHVHYCTLTVDWLVTHIVVLPYLLLPLNATSRLPLLIGQLQLYLKHVAITKARESDQSCNSTDTFAQLQLQLESFSSYYKRNGLISVSHLIWLTEEQCSLKYFPTFTQLHKLPRQ